MRSDRCIRLTFRLGWAALFVTHAYWLTRALFAPGASVSSPVLLAPTLALFLLKMLDVRWLQVSWNRRALLSAILVAVLAHSQVLQQRLADDVDVRLMALPATLVTSVAVRCSLIAGIWLLLQRRVPRRGGGVTAQRARLYEIVVSIACRLRQRACMLSTAPLRGPPLS